MSLGPRTDGKLALVALIKPFRALRYDEAVAGSLDQLVAPPYDVIPADTVSDMAAANDHNIVRLIRPQEPDLAAERLREWLAHGALVREENAGVWRIAETFVGPDSVSRTRTGVVGRIALEEVGAGSVLRHERTFDRPLETRLQLVRAVQTKLSPVLVLHNGEPPAPEDRDPDLHATLNDTTTSLWRIDEQDAIAATLAKIVAPLVIADGHHRYAAALRHHQEQGTEETAHVLAVLISVADPGLEIFAAHRVASEAPPDLRDPLTATKLESVSEAVAQLDTLERDHAAFVLVEPDGVSLVEAPPAEDLLERLDVTAVNPLVAGDVKFIPSANDAARAVTDGDAAAAFLVRAPTVAQVQGIATSGLVMPQKSTYFYPKLTSGLLLSPLDE